MCRLEVFHVCLVLGDHLLHKLFSRHQQCVGDACCKKENAVEFCYELRHTIN